MKWIKKWFKRKQVKPVQQIKPQQVLTLQIDKSGHMETNIPHEIAQSLNGQAIAQVCKVMGYIAILEMQSTSRTLH